MDVNTVNSHNTPEILAAVARLVASVSPALEDQLIDGAEVSRLTGMGRTWLDERWRTGAFPAPVVFGHKSVRWRRSEVQAWIASLQPANPKAS